MESATFPKTCLIPNSSRTLLKASNVKQIRFDDRHKFKIRAMSEVVVDSLNSTPVEVSWEIIVGFIAGTVPFVVAGIEFSKRINAQRNCTTCKGSGLVRREKYFFRCPGCGGFLPWQSWRRFFTG